MKRVIQSFLLALVVAAPALAQGPSSVEQILRSIFDSANNALRFNAVASGGGANPPDSGLNTEQTFRKIFDSANNALRANIVVGGGAAGGSSGQPQFNNAGAFAGQPNTVVVAGTSGAIAGLTLTSGTRYIISASDTETAAKAVAVSNVTIECVPGVTIQQTTASTDLFDINTGADGFALVNCTLNPPASGVSGQLINVNGANRVRLDDLTINTIASTATNGANGWIRIQSGSHNSIRRFKILNSADEGILLTSSGTTVADTKISDGFFQTTATGKEGLAINPDQYFNLYDVFLDNLQFESAGRCVNFLNPTSKLHASNLTCKWTAGGTSDIGFRFFGCRWCTFSNLIGWDNGFAHVNAEMLSGTDMAGSVIDGFVLYMTSGGSTPMSLLASYDMTVANGTITGNVGVSTALDGWGAANSAITITSAAASSKKFHNHVKNITIVTPPAYTGTLIHIDCTAATNGGICDDTEVSGIHGFGTGGTFLDLAIANGGTANNCSFHDNTVQGFTTGFSVPAGISGTRIYNNQYPGTTTPFNFSSAVWLHELGGITFAKLPTAANMANGSLVFVSDSNATCAAGASTGKFCAEENGAIIAAF